jgi:hypothetical protein
VTGPTSSVRRRKEPAAKGRKERREIAPQKGEKPLKRFFQVLEHVTPR